MIHKRAQLTAMTLLGIVLLIIVVVLFLLQWQRNQAQQPSSSLSLSLTAKEVYSYVQSCLENTLPTGIFLLGKQAGYYYPPQDSLQTEEGTVPFYYQKGSTKIPTLNAIEAQLSLFVRENLPLCTDFSSFPALTIIPSPVTSTVVIRENDILVEMTYPLTLQKGTQTIALTTPYTTTLPVRLSRIHYIASEIVMMEQQDPHNVDVALLLETDLDIAIIPYNNQTIIYSITDKQSIINEIPYTFIFANEI